MFLNRSNLVQPSPCESVLNVKKIICYLLCISGPDFDTHLLIWILSPVTFPKYIDNHDISTLCIVYIYVYIFSIFRESPDLDMIYDWLIIGWRLAGTEVTEQHTRIDVGYVKATLDHRSDVFVDNFIFSSFLNGNTRTFCLNTFPLQNVFYKCV